MALTDAELYEIKYQLGYNLLTIGAIPYIQITQLFEQVIQPYLESGVNTTSSTTVTAATAATPATLTLADVTGFAALGRVIVDVDDREETATIQNVSGSTITVLLKLAHTGTYPVILEGSESKIRDLLRKLRTVEKQIVAATNTAGLKRVDVIEFYGANTQTSQTAMLKNQLMHWRDQLASALGVRNLWRDRASAGQVLSNY